MKKTRIIALLAAALAVAGTAMPVLASKKQDAASVPATLDRSALIRLADDYIAALVAHDPKRVPFASDAKFVEQIKRARVGEGLWKTVTSGATQFKIVVPDPVSQQVGGILVMGVDGKPTQIGFRLKIVAGKIAEVEHLIAVSGSGRPLSENLLKVRPAIPLEVPYEYADSRGRMIHIAKSYYDALDDNNGHLAPFAPDCERHENGMRTAPNGGPSLSGPGVPGQPPAPPSLVGLEDCTSQMDSGTFQYISVIDNRRVEIADPVTGLAIGFSHFHHEMKQKQYPILGDPGRTSMTMNFDPFDLPAMHIYKIWGGQIHEIEAMGFMAPYNSPSGWQ